MKINLLVSYSDPSSTREVHLLRSLLITSRNCTFLGIVLFAGLVAQQKQIQPSLLECWSHFKPLEDIRERSLQTEHPNPLINALRRNFLANEKINDPATTEQFRSSGLSHLLALSGGQTGPAADVFCKLIILSFLLGAKTFRSLNIKPFFNHIRFCVYCVHTIIVFILVGLYQSSGALNRNFSASLTRGVGAYAMLSHSTRKRSARWFRPVFLATPWLFGWILHHNPVRDLSFLLSALGGLSSQFIQRLLHSQLEHHQYKSEQHQVRAKFIHRLTGSHLCHSVSSWVLGTAFASSLMCLLTWPLWPPENITGKILANILAGPCVLLIITPASMGICIALLMNAQHFEGICQRLLNFGLSLLTAIADAFSSVDVPVTGATPSLHIFTSTHLQRPDSCIAILAFEVLCLTAGMEFLRALNSDFSKETPRT